MIGCVLGAQSLQLASMAVWLLHSGTCPSLSSQMVDRAAFDGPTPIFIGVGTGLQCLAHLAARSPYLAGMLTFREFIQPILFPCRLLQMR
jgi:hypothetical protein